MADSGKEQSIGLLDVVRNTVPLEDYTTATSCTRFLWGPKGQ